MKHSFNAKNIILSVVALILVMMLAVGVTYSWIEDVKQVQFSTKQEGDEAPLKTGTDINAVAEIVQDSTNHNTINLGNILQDSDLKDTTTGNFLSAVTSQNQAKMNDIDKKKGYFYESGEMHLSPCYSDGVDFYFPVLNADGSAPSSGVKYRKGNKNDENVNYIDFTFKVSSPDANTVYWFDGFPYIKTAGAASEYANELRAARLAITVDGVTKIMSFEGGTDEGHKVTGVSSSVTTYTPDRYAKYIYNDSTHNPNNANTLFSVAKGETKNVNVKIWIDAGASNSAVAADIDIPIVSSWAKSISFNLEDKTSGTWAITNSTKFYVAFPAYYDTYGNWVENKNYFEFTSTNASSHNGSFTVPAVYSGEYAYIYRCSSDGWDAASNTNTLPNANDKQPNNSHPIKAYNYWKTTLPNSYKPTNSDTYKFYGGAYDDTAATAIEGNSNKATHMGVGTWGTLHELKLNSKYRHDTNGVLGHTDSTNGTPFANYDNDNGIVYIRDFSDEDTVGAIYTYRMTWESNVWKTYIPESSKLIQFYYYHKNYSQYKGWWGYRSDNNQCPQQRPDGVWEYQIAGNHEGKKGVAGFWKDSNDPDKYNHIFLIKSGSLFYDDYNVYAYLWTPKDNQGNNWYSWDKSGMGSSGEPDYNSSPVLKTNATVYAGDRLWVNVRFENSDGTHKTGDLFIYAGCYYDVSANKWYGSLEHKEINTLVTDTSGDASLVEPSTTYPSSNGIYLNIQKGGNYYYKLSDSTGSSAAGSSIKVELGASNDYTVWIIKYDNGGTNYGTGSNNPNDYFDPSSGNNRDFSTGTGSPVRMHVTTAGKYYFTMDSVTNTNIRLSFSSAS